MELGDGTHAGMATLAEATINNEGQLILTGDASTLGGGKPGLGRCFFRVKWLIDQERVNVSADWLMPNWGTLYMQVFLEVH